MESIDRGEYDTKDAPVEAAHIRDDVLDFTGQDYNEDEIERSKVRISNGINTRDLVGTDGFVFESELDNNNNDDENGKNNYFATHMEELERLVAEQKMNGTDKKPEEELEDMSEFDQIKRAMYDVGTPGEEGSVLKRILKTGVQTGGCVPSGATVTLHYSLQLEGQDEPFDSSVLRGRRERYKLDQGQLIEGLEVGVRTMTRDEKSQFLINWTHAYGRQGCPPRVPEQAVILATVELLEFVEEGQADALLGMDSDERNKKHSYEQIEAVVRIEHQNGNTYVKREEWKMALKHYERGVRLLQEVRLATQGDEDRQQRLLLKLLLNTAHCCIKLKWPKKACVACRESLDVDERHSTGDQITRALYRFGKAKRMLEDYKMSKELLLKAQTRSPQDPHISKELLSLEDQLAREKKNEVALCKGMFRHAKPTKQEEKREEAVNQLADNFREEMELFSKQEGANEMLLPATFSSMEVKALRQVAEQLEMEVVVEEDHRGNKKIRVSKRNSGGAN